MVDCWEKVKMFSTSVELTQLEDGESGGQDPQVRSAVSPALFHDSRNPLLILPLVLLVQLSCLTVGWTVGIWFIKQGLERRRWRVKGEDVFLSAFLKSSTSNSVF